MAETKFGRKTSPGFADPQLPGGPPVDGAARGAPETQHEGGVAVIPAPRPAATPPHPVPVHPQVQPEAAPAVAAPPPAPVQLPNVHPAAAPPAREERPRGTPLVEFEVTHERGPAPRAEPLRRCFEVWTRNHIYAVDSRMQCIEVRKPGTGEVIDDHPFLGTRLVGGQLQENDTVEMSYPLPRPGSFAVFEGRKKKRRQFSRTSAVTRVVLRLRIVTVTDSGTAPTWEQIADES